MFEIFKRLKQPYDEAQILNDGLRLAMAFGDDWLKPIQTRLVRLYPELDMRELDEYNNKCQFVMKAGHDLAYSLGKESGKKASFNNFRKNLGESFPWINDKNLKRLFSQGMYYAYKDFGL